MKKQVARTAHIRQFLSEAFSDEDLSTLCFDYFPDVYDDFAAGMTKGQKLRLLIEYCQRREIIPNLLVAVQKARPEQYQERFPQVPLRPEEPRLERDSRQVFISHAHEDADFAHRLASDLRKYGWRIWIAPDSLRPGEKWMDGINRGLDESGTFVLALTAAAVKSRWVQDETNAAIQLEQQGHLRFIPLYVESCGVPPLWGIYQHISFSDDYKNGLTKLLAELGQTGSLPLEIKESTILPAPVMPKPDPGVLLHTRAATSPLSKIWQVTLNGAPLLLTGLSVYFLLENLGLGGNLSANAELLLFLGFLFVTGLGLFPDAPPLYRTANSLILCLVAIGIVFWGSRLAPPLGVLWPVIFIFLGLYSLLRRRQH